MNPDDFFDPEDASSSEDPSSSEDSSTPDDSPSLPFQWADLQKDFKQSWKDPNDFICVFVADPQQAAFVYFPYPVAEGGDEI